MWKPSRQCVALFIWSVIVVAGASGSLVSCRKPDTATQKGEPLRTTIRVEQGDDVKAKAYYAETFAALGIPADLAKDEPNLSVMLSFLGYTDLAPADLENTPSVELMSRLGEDVLVSAFFAPKITDGRQSGSENINVGWRKVIRLRSKPGSAAAAKNIASGFLLFNKFQGKNNANADPFKKREDKSNESQTTQLILVRAGKSSGPEPINRPLHFFVFGPISQEAKLKLALQASFDAAAPDVESELTKTNGIKDYFVPIACGQCHGGLKPVNQETGVKEVEFARQKVNFLDTDHWFDRVQDGDDFAFLRQTSFGVLFDGDKDEAAPRFAAAFDVLRRLNTEIKEQNELVETDPSKPSFQLRAITKWLQLHAANDNGHKELFARALPPLTGAGPAWSSSADPDRRLLKMLNQYCYRCHSSIIYNIFDRHEVACRKANIRKFVNLAPENARHMPQDRVLDASTKTVLLDLVSQLPDAICSQ